ncbi:MAG: cytidylate kinase-like family protein [Candidatus Eremiobacteraeota bacterium]|nr:cytidylate kinase-like family protein [Candidatus Eremiobacteraeota bacterium]
MIVTISNEYGSGAHAIALAAANALGYRFIDKELPVVVAKRLSTSPEAVDAAEDTSRNLGERLISGLEAGTPELAFPQTGSAGSFDRDVFRAVGDAVREFAALGRVVLFGRGANAVLGRRDDVLRVFMHAPRDWRIAHIMAVLGVDVASASAEVERIDKARRAYMQEYYGLDWGDPCFYDLSIDTARFGPERSTNLIVDAVNQWP